MRQFIAIFAAFLTYAASDQGDPLDHKEKAGIRPSAFGDRHLSGFDRGGTCCKRQQGFYFDFHDG